MSPEIFSKNDLKFDNYIQNNSYSSPSSKMNLTNKNNFSSNIIGKMGSVKSQ